MFSQLTRAERSGCIFNRILGLLIAGHLKWEQRPVWFDAYIAHPPHYEPKWDIKMPKHDEPVPKIFYQEDIIRALAQKAQEGQESIRQKERRARKREELKPTLYMPMTTDPRLLSQMPHFCLPALRFDYTKLVCTDSQK